MLGKLGLGLRLKVDGGVGIDERAREERGRGLGRSRTDEKKSAISPPIEPQRMQRSQTSDNLHLRRAQAKGRTCTCRRARQTVQPGPDFDLYGVQDGVEQGCI